jgi:hypothetical protein
MLAVGCAKGRAGFFIEQITLDLEVLNAFDALAFQGVFNFRTDFVIT